MESIFANAQEAFEYLYKKISKHGEQFGGTRAKFNCGFTICDPLDREIHTPWRKWSSKYAEREWQWYLSKDRSVSELKKYAPIWDNMHHGDDIVNSNYGFLWSQNDQLKKCIDELRSNPESRRASVSLFDGKDKDIYDKDTPCTFAITFYVTDNLLNMSVQMRSNDLWYGFCNDQYCFSKLQEMVANELGLEVGVYHHFAVNMHIYEGQLGKDEIEKTNYDNIYVK